MGDRHVWSYEIDAENATAHENLPFAFGGQTPICGAALLPKTLCAIKHVELDRMLLMTATSMERVSFSLPRTDALKQFFQDDIYRPARTAEPALSAKQWFAGETAEPVFQSLQPNGRDPVLP
jgi:coronin-1B/1C/6